MKITRSIEFDMGHCVTTQCGSDGLSPCLMPHGHRFKLNVTIEGQPLSDTITNGGMVIDFREVKKILMTNIHDVYDHSFAIWKDDPAANLFEKMKLVKPYSNKIHILDFVPTSENLVKEWFPVIQKELGKLGLSLWSLELFETSNCSCLYTCEDEQ